MYYFKCFQQLKNYVIQKKKKLFLKKAINKNGLWVSPDVEFSKDLKAAIIN